MRASWSHGNQDRDSKAAGVFPRGRKRIQHQRIFCSFGRYFYFGACPPSNNRGILLSLASTPFRFHWFLLGALSPLDVDLRWLGAIDSHDRSTGQRGPRCWLLLCLLRFDV